MKTVSLPRIGSEAGSSRGSTASSRTGSQPTGAVRIKLPASTGGNARAAVPALTGGDAGMTLDMLTAQWQRLREVEGNAFMTPRERQSYVQDLRTVCKGFESENSALREQVRSLNARLAEQEARESDARRALAKQSAVTRVYEHFQFVPPSFSEDSLRKDIEGIEGDIRMTELVTDAHQELLWPALPLDDIGRRWALMELKFTRLEQLIVVLRKKIIRYEENQHLARVMDDYGNLPNMLQDTARLRKENTRLRSREQRFVVDPLLNRYFGEADETFLRVLAMALQNELAAHRAILARYNLARSSASSSSSLSPSSSSAAAAAAAASASASATTAAHSPLAAGSTAAAVSASAATPASASAPAPAALVPAGAGSSASAVRRSAVASAGGATELLGQDTALADLDTWLTDASLANDFSEELEAWRAANGSKPPPQQVTEKNAAQLLAELNVQRTRNDMLARQIAQMEAERTSVANVAAMRAYCDAEFAHPLKGLAKKQFQDVNEKLVEQMQALRAELAQAQGAVSAQLDMIAAATRDKMLAVEETVVVGRRVQQLVAQNGALRARLERASHLCHSLYLANLSTIQGVLADKLPADAQPHFVQRYHRDLLLTYLRFHNAALALQAWFRGTTARRWVRLQYAFVARASLRVKPRRKRLVPAAMRDYLAGAPASTQAAFALAPPAPGATPAPGTGGAGGGGGAVSDSAAAAGPAAGAAAGAAAVGGGGGDDGDDTAPIAPVEPFLPVLRTLATIVLHVEGDVRAVTQLQSLLRICRLEIQRQLKPSLEKELRRWQRYLVRKQAHVVDAVVEGLRPPEQHDFAQQMFVMGVEAGTQTEEEAPDDTGKGRRKSRKDETAAAAGAAAGSSSAKERSAKGSSTPRGAKTKQ